MEVSHTYNFTNTLGFFQGQWMDIKLAFVQQSFLLFIGELTNAFLSLHNLRSVN